MLKSIFMILMLVNWMSFSEAAPKGKEGCNFVLAVDNSNRFVHPEGDYPHPRFLTKQYFDGLAHGAYDREDRVFFTAQIKGTIAGAHPSSPSQIMLQMSLRTAPAGDAIVWFNLRSRNMIRPEARAKLTIEMRPLGGAGHVVLSRDFMRRSVDLGADANIHFTQSLNAEGFLTRQDILNRMRMAAQRFSASSALEQVERVGTWNSSPRKATIQIDLDSLTAAEFSVLVNALVERIQDRIILTDEEPSSDLF